MHVYTFFLVATLAVACTSPSGNTKTIGQQPADGQEATDTQPEENKIILVFGNSLTAGYGLDVDQSFPARLQQRLDSLNLPYTIVNAGVSGETTATGLSRIDWVLDKQNVDIFILELGANDGLRGVPPAETKKNLIEMIDKVRMAYPEVQIIVAGMLVPPSMGQDYSERYSKIYPEIAEEKKVALIPFLLQDVGGIASMNQGDGIHPNEKGARVVTENVWKVLGPMVF